MTEIISVREKTTSDISMVLLSNEDAIDLTDVDHVELEMIDKSRKTYHYSSDDSPSYLAIADDPTTGVVTFTPPGETIFLYQRSPYRLYIKIYETSTKHYAVPENDSAEILITKEY